MSREDEIFLSLMRAGKAWAELQTSTGRYNSGEQVECQICEWFVKYHMLDGKANKAEVKEQNGKVGFLKF